ncbi:MAG TPA: hypothetical protein VF612_12475 [Jatrophihabitans sp.]|jgi:hypothetical protein|uniref:hypothetical protein n=1 Tax=Jatrophihabitans sp. TaxID=1932789 RepID=UPI002F18458B
MSSAQPEIAAPEEAPRELLLPEDIEALFPADPDLMVSPEGDARGLREVKAAALARRAELAARARARR